MSINYIKSDKVKIYPSAFRGFGYNPESRLNTEQNIRTFTKSLTDYDGFVIHYNNTSTDKNIKFNLGGYYFEAKLADILNTYNSSSTDENGNIVNRNYNLYVGIKLQNHNNSDDAKSYNGSTLISIYSNEITTLDRESDGLYYFDGLKFTDMVGEVSDCDYSMILLNVDSESNPSGTVPESSYFKFNTSSISFDGSSNINNVMETGTMTVRDELIVHTPSNSGNGTTIIDDEIETKSIEAVQISVTDTLNSNGDFISKNKSEENILSHTNSGIEYGWNAGKFPSVPKTPPHILDITPNKGNIVSSLNKYYPYADISINANSIGIHHNLNETMNLKDLTASESFSYTSATNPFSKENTYDIRIVKAPDVNTVGLYNQFQDLKFKGLLGNKIVSEIDANRRMGPYSFSNRFDDDINNYRTLSDEFPTLKSVENTLYAQQGLKLYGPSVLAPNSEFRHLVFHGNYIKESSGNINPTLKPPLSKPSDYEYTQGPLGYISTFIDVDTTRRTADGNIDALFSQPRYGLRLAATNPLGNNLWPSGAFLDMDTTGELSIRVNPYAKAYSNYHTSGGITKQSEAKVFSVKTGTDVESTLAGGIPSEINITPRTLNINPSTLNITPDFFIMHSVACSLETEESTEITAESLDITTHSGIHITGPSGIHGEVKLNTSLKLGDNVPVIDSGGGTQYKSTSLGIVPYVSEKFAAKYISINLNSNWWNHTVSTIQNMTSSTNPGLFEHNLQFSYSGMSSEPQKNSTYIELLKMWKAHMAGEPVYLRQEASGGGGDINSGNSTDAVRNTLVYYIALHKEWNEGKLISTKFFIRYRDTISSNSNSGMYLYTQPVIGSDGKFYDENLFF